MSTNDKHDITDRQLERSLRSAGERPALDPDHLEQITRAARAQFESSWGSRDGREPAEPASETDRGPHLPLDETAPAAEGREVSPLLWLAAAAVLVLAAVGVFQSLREAPADVLPAGAPVHVATLRHVDGEAPDVVLSAEREPVEIGGSVRTGSVVSTRGAIALETVNGGSLRLDVGTVVAFHAPDHAELIRGAVYFDSGMHGAAPAGSLTIETPRGNVTHIGTQYAVRLLEGGRMRVRVREGLVELSLQEVRSQVQAGTQLIVDADGHTEQLAIAPHDPEWLWITAAAPAPGAELESTQDLLAWICRENGWRLRFDGAGAERRAASPLHGPAGIRPQSSLDDLRVIAAGSKLDLDLEDEGGARVLTVRELQPTG